MKLDGKYKHGLVDVVLSDDFLKRALTAQRECETRGEPFIIRLLNDDDPKIDPIFAIAILTIPVIDASISTRGHMFNWKN